MSKLTECTIAGSCVVIVLIVLATFAMAAQGMVLQAQNASAIKSLCTQQDANQRDINGLIEEQYYLRNLIKERLK